MDRPPAHVRLPAPAAGAPNEPFLRARFRLDDGSRLRFIDLRKFARCGSSTISPVLAASARRRSTPRSRAKRTI
jgi:hypothetical protein